MKFQTVLFPSKVLLVLASLAVMAGCRAEKPEPPVPAAEGSGPALNIVRADAPATTATDDMTTPSEP